MRWGRLVAICGCVCIGTKELYKNMVRKIKTRFLTIVSLFFLLNNNVFAQGLKNTDSIITYYVSSTSGDDRNDGLSEYTPKATINSIKKKQNLQILLKRGDIFYECLYNYKNCLIGSYGNDNAQPVVCGFKILTNPSAWKRVEGDVWALSLANESNFKGFSAKQSANKTTVNNVGLIYDSKKDKVYGHLVKRYDMLEADGDFFMTEAHRQEYFDKHPFDTLYWKTSIDPRTFDQLCFSTYSNGISSIWNSTVRDISIVGFSIHGITRCNDCVIENCQIDLIGGATFVRDREPWCRYGNGIELWSNNNGNLINGCLISRTFDCATTIQGTPTKAVIVRNNHFMNNRIYHCRQAFEHFLLDQGTEGHSDYENCSFENNICYEMGENEFSSPESRDANILSYETGPRSIVIKNNIFFGAPYVCGYNFGKGMTGNTVYVYPDQYLNHYHGKRNYATINASTKTDIQAYFQRTYDNSKIIILRRGSRKSNRIGKRTLKKIGWKPVKVTQNE